MLLNGKRSADVSAKSNRPSRRSALSQAAGALIESLESRDLFASTFTLSGSILTVKGSSSSANSFSAWHDSAKTKLYVASGGTTKTYSKSAVTHLKIIGGNYGDYVNTMGVGMPQSVDTGAGNDTIKTGLGNDTIASGGGNDSINASSGNDSILTGSGNDTIYAGAGNDSINGNDGNDKLYGESGRDSLDGSTGTDTGNGGSETDVGINLESKTSIEGTIGGSTGGSTGSSGGSTGGGSTPGGSTGGTGGGIIGGNVGTDANAPKPTPHITVVSSSSLKAGQSVFVHGVSSSLGAGTAITARYEWDFGDPNGEYNKLVGFNAAHVYTKPGTYTVKLRIINELRGAAETSVTINVADDGRRQIFVSNDGSDSNDGSSASKAVQSWARASALVKNVSNAEILFNRGDRFDVKSVMIIGGENVRVGSYGSGDKPVLRYAGSRNQGQFIRIDYHSRNTQIDGLTFDSIWNGVEFDHNGMPFALKVDGDYNTVTNCTFLSVAFALQTNERPAGVLVQDCDAPSAYALRDYFVWGQGSDFVLLGNNVANVINEHAVRIFGVDRLLIAYGSYANPRNYSFEPDKNALNLQEANFVSVYGVTVKSNWQVGPLGDGDGLPWKNARLNNVVIENSRTIGVRLRVVHGAQNIMIRNNILQNDGDSIINVDAYNSSYGRGVSNLNIINNTGINNSTKGRFLYVGGQASNISLVNNLYKADNLLVGEYTASGVYINAGGFSSFRTISNNVWPSPEVSWWIKLNAQGGTGIHIVGPNVIANYYNMDEWNNSSSVGTDYQQDTSLDSRYTPGSSTLAAVSGAKYAGVFTDYYGNARPLNATWSVGAVEV